MEKTSQDILTYWNSQHILHSHDSLQVLTNIIDFPIRSIYINVWYGSQPNIFIIL